MRIASISFERFKAFRGYSLVLDGINILVGPNNSGKSTIVSAIRALASGLRVARSSEPVRVTLLSGMTPGYRVPESSLPISLENVHTDYEDTETSIVFALSNRNKLRLVFPAEGGCFLIPEAEGVRITSRAAFQKHFPITVACVPVLGPVEHREVRRERSTVLGGLSTHRASRHFRSYWHHFPEGFTEFSALVAQTWPGMEILPPEVSDPLKGELTMFCREDRIDRELYWVGFGFQVWCQMLTHLSRVSDATLVVVDEPEVYLHPDVQRQLLAILRELGPDVLLATHSTEIMAEADPSEIILVDKKSSRGLRLKDTAGVQRALEAVGSIQNITLTALARNRRVLFVEGIDDFRLLRRIARRLGLSNLSTGTGVTPLASGGFGSWQRINSLASAIEPVLGTTLKIAAIYDRDYFCDEEVDSVVASLAKDLRLAHVLGRKEIENYLLIPAVLQKALQSAVTERAHRSNSVPDVPLDVAKELDEITSAMRDNVLAQLIAKRATYFRSSGKDIAQISREALTWFSARWERIETRLEMVPGKEVLAQLRDRIQSRHGISLSDARIADAMNRSDIPSDLIDLLEKIDEFRSK
ncbi:ATP-dependent nuclease [Solimonas sp. K1W22B-7]|uniref:ATP-dependent nuclease n=1 Tax=Solimonas sp. K1W22B-7 TaxID=2303331 RepID=UPI00210F307E|nr:ATP-binding protein [Solimonas sp. K1W22B-7]